jgi:hypothetical protein
MAQISFPWENIDTSETQFSQFFRNLGRGVAGAPGGTALEVTQGFTGLTVDVDEGQAMVIGHYYINTAKETLTLATADNDDDRIDTIILRLDDDANSIVLAVKTGTPATNPVPPTLVQTDPYGIYEYALANVLVPAQSGVPGTITDRRDFIGERVGSWTTAGRPTVTNPTFGFNVDLQEVELWDGTQWRPAFPGTALDDLVDVELTTPVAGEILIYDDSDSKWKNQPTPSPFATTFLLMGA